MLIFELINVESDKEYQYLTNAPVENRKSRDDFATIGVLIEFDASKKTRLYFRSHPLAGASYKNDPYYVSLTANSGDFSDYLHWLDTLGSKGLDPREYYRRAYDKLLSVPSNGAK
jgi:hypothetical protein